MTLGFSRRLAILFGVALPLLETYRRWRQLGDLSVWPFWLDDWLIGLFLLYGAWRTREDIAAGQPFLAAGWGFTCAMAYMSFFTQLANLGQPDPSGWPALGVVTVKGTGLVLSTIALVVVLRWKPEGGGR